MKTRHWLGLVVCAFFFGFMQLYEQEPFWRATTGAAIAFWGGLIGFHWGRQTGRSERFLRVHQTVRADLEKLRQQEERAAKERVH